QLPAPPIRFQDALKHLISEIASGIIGRGPPLKRPILSCAGDCAGPYFNNALRLTRYLERRHEGFLLIRRHGIKMVDEARIVGGIERPPGLARAVAIVVE